MTEKDILGSGHAVFNALWSGLPKNGFILKTVIYYHQNRLKDIKAAKATVVAALAVWEKARI